MAFLLALSFLLPMINGFAIVKVHRNALYHPQFWCSFLGNASLSDDASIQTCIWTCTHKRLCRTIVYYNNEQICSMFDEHVRLGRIVSSEDVRASVIVLIETNSRIVDPTCFDPIVPCSPITESPSRIRWSFDGHANDLYNVYNGTEENGATYVSPGYNGQGSALSLKGSQSQYVLVPTYKNLTYTSFTWEIWAYPLDLGTCDHR